MTEEKTGDLIPMRYRCNICGGNGSFSESDEPCPLCSGAGYYTGLPPRLAARRVFRTSVKMNPGKKMKRRKTEAKPRSPLVGRFFHTFTIDLPREGRGEVQNQGVVLSDLGGGYFMIQLFEFITGHASSKHVVHVERMAANGWSFYESADEMRERYEYYCARAFSDMPTETS